MTEHRPEPAQQADPLAALRCVTLPEIPTVCALDHPEDGVTAWVFVLPGGLAVIVPRDDDGNWTVHTTLDKVVNHRAPGTTWTWCWSPPDAERSHGP